MAARRSTRPDNEAITPLSDEVPSTDLPVTAEPTLLRKPPRREPRTATENLGPRAETIPIDEMYRALEAGSVELRTALGLLRDALLWIDRALAHVSLNELLEADEAMTHVHLATPELFCCRVLGDGFAAITNAVQSSFENRDGEPLNSGHMRAIRSALLAIRTEPGISFERALEIISPMEDSGLLVDPAGLEAVTEWLSE